jgi:DNA-binding beta-propeller fold protein YncE
MIQRFLWAVALTCIAAAACCAAPAPSLARRPAPGAAKVSVTMIDFLESADVSANGAGPLLLKLDSFRNRMIVANTLSSSVSIIDCKGHAVENIPIAGRALQHLKAEALTFRRKTGEVCLIGARCFAVAFPDSKTSKTIPTPVQFESIAVDEQTGNIFLAGRESTGLGFYAAGSGKLTMLPWLETRENLINLNATPPPPIRKVIPAPELGWIIGIDGYTSALFLFDGRNGRLVNSRALKLTSGGRWHLAGYDETNHQLYLVVETNDRRVIEAAKVDVITGESVVTPLPAFTEGAGITANPARDEVYIPYDNHPSVHVVDFKDGGRITEIKIPTFGNDASAVDANNGILYVASWAQGEVDVIDLADRKLEKRITGLGIIPHMFSMQYNPNNNLLYYPKGATAVNGTFGAAVTTLDPVREDTKKIYTGWAPMDLVEVPARGCFFIFDSEDRLAEVYENGSCEMHTLPCEYPVAAILDPEGNVCLSYGPHQSYWPVVYIWGAKDGILGIGAKDLSFYDRRIPRQALAMVFDGAGVLCFTQNIWGREAQMLGTLADEVRLFDIGTRIMVPDTIERETAQRILRYDPDKNWLYLVRVAERDEDPSVLHIIDPDSRSDIRRIPVGITATDLEYDAGNIYVSNFDSRSVSVIDKASFTVDAIATGDGPLKLCRLNDATYVVNHLGASLQEVRENGKVFHIPFEGHPDNLFVWGDGIVVTLHSATALSIVRFDPASATFALLHRYEYPYGDTRLDSDNVSFFLRGQFGDAVFSLTKGATSAGGAFWMTDFLSGKLFILKAE